MDLTVAQALQRGIEAHKDGELQDAERFYRAILQTIPNHPVANHNLGVLAVSVNKTGSALPLFKKATEAAPRVEQFWLSYINALIKEQQVEKAKEALAEAKKQDAAIEKLNALEEQLISINKQKSINRLVPSQPQISDLLNKYQNSRYEEAMGLAKNLIEQYPKYQLAWKVLGVLLQQCNQIKEALEANKRSIQLGPKDPEAHYNLGVVLNELGRWEEAAASYRNAIKITPDYVKAYSNLGDALKALSKFEDAETNYQRAIRITPEISELYNNLGVTLEKLRKSEEARTSYIKAIYLKPEFAEAQNNLGNILQQTGKMEEASASYAKAIYLKPGFAEAYLNLSTNLSYMDALDKEICAWQSLIQLDLDKYRMIAGVNLAICYFLQGDFSQSSQYLIGVQKSQDIGLLEFQNAKVYQKYLLNILNWHEQKYPTNHVHKNNRKLYVIGESHSLAAHLLTAKTSDDNLLCVAKLIKGCMQWHLGNPEKNQYKNKLECIFGSLPQTSEVLLTIGEIDCRLDSGIIRHKKTSPKKEIEGIIISTVENYLNYIVEINQRHQHNIIIQGVPCPNIDTGPYSEKEIDQLINVIEIMNFQLETKSKAKGFCFLDVRKLTDRGDGLSNSIWHIDNIHLSPDGFLEAWNQYSADQ